jgi:alpha-L-fucosidase 2
MLPNTWKEGQVVGLRARGGFEIDLRWEKGQLDEARIRSKLGKPCRVKSASDLRVSSKSSEIPNSKIQHGVIEFETQAGGEYILSLA